MSLDLNELTLATIGDWPPLAKVLTIALVCILLSAGIFFLDTKAQLSQLAANKRKEADLISTLEIKQHMANGLPLYRKQIKTMKREFADMLQKLPGRSEVPGLLEDISEIGRTSGLAFKLFKPLPEVNKDFYAELPIKISVVGNYHELALFVSRIANLNRIVILHNLSLRPVGPVKDPFDSEQKEKLFMEMMAKTYRYTAEKKAQ